MLLEKRKMEAKEFVEKNVMPLANKIDEAGKIPIKIIEELKSAGYLGLNVSKEYGGLGYSYSEIEVIIEQFGRACSSVRSILTVHGMVTMAIEKWGSKDCKDMYLNKLAMGNKLGAFCLTEPNAGSDTNSITTEITENEDFYILNGTKKWITMGQIADIFLVFGKLRNAPVALVIDKENVEGIEIEPIKNINGMRGSELAKIIFNDCRIKKQNLIGGVGFGLSQVALSSLLYGRFTIACGCVGTAEECLNLSIQYAKNRKQFGEKLYKHQLIKKLITEITVDIRAGKVLCENVAKLLDERDSDASVEAFVSKYYCSKMIMRVVDKAIQIHGANGLTIDIGLERFYRDAKIIEIIEGTSQIHEIIIANNEMVKRK